MAFFTNFRKSAMELKSVKCLAVTAVLIAVACVLKSLTLQVSPTMKIGFSFIAIASIGMLYGPVVAGLSCVATDVIGYFVSNQANAFSPLFTLVEVVGGVIYGIFLYNLNPIKIDFGEQWHSALKKQLKSNVAAFVRVLLAKLTVNLVCNVVMNTTFMVVMNYYAPDLFWLKIWERIVKNVAMLPIEIFILLVTLFPIKAAYMRVFRSKSLNKAG